MYEIAEIYKKLRGIALQRTPENLGLTLDPGRSVPYGILMELGWPSAIVTLAAFSTGDASLYFSNGGGILGGVKHESVRSAAQSFVRVSEPLLARMAKSTDFPTPSPGMVRFHVLTNHGAYTAEASEADLQAEKGGFTPLYAAGQGVITAVRLSSPQR